MTDATKPIDLKSCPFCGGNAVYVQAEHYAQCKDNSCDGGADIDTWNRRPEPTEAQIEAAAKVLAHQHQDDYDDLPMISTYQQHAKYFDENTGVYSDKMTAIKDVKTVIAALEASHD